MSMESKFHDQKLMNSLNSPSSPCDFQIWVRLLLRCQLLWRWLYPAFFWFQMNPTQWDWICRMVGATMVETTARPNMCLANQNEQKFNIFLSNPEMQPQKGFTTWNSSILVGRVLKKTHQLCFKLYVKRETCLTRRAQAPKFRFLHPSCFWLLFWWLSPPFHSWREKTTKVLMDNICVLQGMIKDGAQNVLIAQLPEACRPKANRLIFNMNLQDRAMDTATNRSFRWLNYVDLSWTAKQKLGIIFQACMACVPHRKNIGNLWRDVHPDYLVA